MGFSAPGCGFNSHAEAPDAVRSKVYGRRLTGIVRFVHWLFGWLRSLCTRNTSVPTVKKELAKLGMRGTCLPKSDKSLAKS